MESLKKIRGDNQKKFFDFVNADVAGMGRSEFVSFLFQYEELLRAFSDKFQSDGIPCKRMELVTIANGESDEAFNVLRTGFSQLQAYLKGKLNVIADGPKGKKAVNAPIATITATHELYADLDSDSFTLKSLPVALSPGLDVEQDKKVLDLILVSMLTEYNLKPSRLSTCARAKCGSIFFRHTDSTKYCSTRCSGAEVQAAKRKRDKAAK
ncbi:MAG: hypothetical protein HGA96_03550 [Desulfobulbaceae bacterium]|nr:hypothetical protein [Desulfobulbaceae bacterium]